MKHKLLAASLLCLALGSASVHASTLYWSSNGTTLGGGGTWDTTTARWGTSTSGPFTTVWNNAGSDNATLSGGAGATPGGSVVLGANITMNGTLTWQQTPSMNPSYSIDGASTLTFSASSVLSCNHSGGSGLGVGTFNAAYAGTITKSGTAQVEFSNSSGNVTKFIFKQGIASFAAPSLYGSGADVSDFLTFDGGTLRMNTTTAWTQARSITVNSGGGTITSSSSTITLTQDKPITWSGGNLTVNISPLILSSTTSSGSGTLTLTTATTCNAAGVIPSTVLVGMAAGATLALNGFDQTIKSVSGSAGTVAVGASTLTLADPQSHSYTSVFTGSGKIVKNGNGPLTLSGSSTGFTGEFDLNGGTVGVGGVNCFGGVGGTGLLVINNSPTVAAFNGTLRAMTIPVTLNGNVTFDDTYTANPGSITWNTSGWTLSAGTHTITVNRAADTYIITIGAAVTESGGTANLTKAGNGVLELKNSGNNYSGGTTVRAGKLVASVAGRLGSGNVSVASGATLQLDSTTAMNSTANLTLASTPTAGSGILNFTGTQTINAFYFGTTQKATGTWGSVSSSAVHKNAAFTGTGLLNVTDGPATTTVLSSITPNPACAGASVNLTATVTGNAPAGGVEFFDGATSLGTATLSGGLATKSVSTLSVGTHNNITAKYLGDDNNNQSTSSAGSVTVNAAAATSAITGSSLVAIGQVGKTYSVTPTSESSYAWTVPSGASIAAGAGTASIQVNFGSAVVGNITVTETTSASCVGSPVSLAVTVGPNHAPQVQNIEMGAQSGVKQTLQIIGSPKYALTDDDPLDTLTLSGWGYTSGHGATVAINGNSVEYTAPSTFTGPDSFGYTVSDGRGGTATATVNVDVSAVINQRTSQISFSEGSVALTFWGVPGDTYTIQRATDVNGPWDNLAPTVTALTTQPYGQISFTDSTPPLQWLLPAETLNKTVSQTQRNNSL